MLHLPPPDPKPYYILILDPVFFDPLRGWDVLKAGTIIGKASRFEEFYDQLTPEQKEKFQHWNDHSSDAVWSDKHNGYILEGHEEFGFSFLTRWLVPPDSDFVARHLLEICNANPGYFKDWYETDSGELPALYLEYIDLMQPILHHIPPRARRRLGEESGFFKEVFKEVITEAEAWKARQI